MGGFDNFPNGKIEPKLVAEWLIKSEYLLKEKGYQPQWGKLPKLKGALRHSENNASFFRPSEVFQTVVDKDKQV